MPFFEKRASLKKDRKMHFFNVCYGELRLYIVVNDKKYSCSRENMTVLQNGFQCRRYPYFGVCDMAGYSPQYYPYQTVIYSSYTVVYDRCNEGSGYTNLCQSNTKNNQITTNKKYHLVLAERQILPCPMSCSVCLAG